MTTALELEKKLSPLWSENPVWRGADINIGWYKLVSDLVDALEELGLPYKIEQVKEKFGGLRFYVSCDSEDYGAIMHTIVGYENLSFKTCETCAEPGEPRNDLGWVATLCDEHYNRRKILR